MKSRSNLIATLKFVVIAVAFMLLADYFIFGGKRSYIEEAKQQAHQEKQAVQAVQESQRPPPVRVDPGEGKDFFESIPMEEPIPPQANEEPLKTKEDAGVIMPPLPKAQVEGRPKIAIIIDDVGMDIKRSRAVLDFPPEVTLAFLPYAPRVKELAKMAKEKGHHLIIHVPMEAVDKNLNIGPGGLKEGMSDAELKAAFDVMLASFEGYEGINNHMGSRLTQDAHKMNLVMAALSQKGLYFVDSKTIGNSVGAQAAAKHGVKFASRDVFLDHVETPGFVQRSLQQVEQRARTHGYAVAIGHPKDETIAALRAWFPTLEGKGFELVPVRTLFVTPEKTTKEDDTIAAEPETKAEPEIDMFPEDQAPAVSSSAPLNPAPEPQILPPPIQSPVP